MTHDELARLWEQHARLDPLWAILSDPTQRGRKWNIRNFFETGRRDISVILHQIDDLGLVIDRGRALDFGCGVGRLTQALGDYFAVAIGVDISPTMIRLAQTLNRKPEHVRYCLNSGDELKDLLTNSFDFVYSDIVLQHIPPDGTVNYIREFLRVLRRGGVAVFQLPSHQRPVVERHRTLERMPEDAYRAELEVLNHTRRLMQSSEHTTLLVTVRNRSAYTWDTGVSGPLRLGNHWLSGDGREMLVQDDGRADLPTVMTPDEITTVSLDVTAPRRPGRYTCEVDVVHEGVAWFHDRGSQTVRVSVTVGADVSTPSELSGSQEYTYPDIYAELESIGEPPAFPMFGVPYGVVSELLSANDADLCLAQYDEHGGPEWIGYRYFVRKR